MPKPGRQGITASKPDGAAGDKPPRYGMAGGTPEMQGAPTTSKWNLRAAVVDFLFPPRCVGCSRRGDWLCPECRASLPRLPSPQCRRCGMPLDAGPVCQQCAEHPIRLDGLRVDYYFEGAVRRAIHQLKYRGGRHMAGPLGELLADSFLLKPPAADVVVPVPLHPRRQAERGYNQSALLAAELVRRTGVPLVEDVLIRSRDTESQMQLSADRRHANVWGAFAARGDGLAGKSVLVVDDVCTTGSTLDACARALKAAGCRQVWGITVARAR